jgi:hypothetical protein
MRAPNSEKLERNGERLDQFVNEENCRQQALQKTRARLHVPQYASQKAGAAGSTARVVEMAKAIRAKAAAAMRRSMTISPVR